MGEGFKINMNAFHFISFASPDAFDNLQLLVDVFACCRTPPSPQPPPQLPPSCRRPMEEEDGFIGVSEALPALDIRMVDFAARSAVTNGRLREGEEDDLARVVRGLLEKEDAQARDDTIRREWKMLAETIDRWLFWTFFFITTVSTLLFLVILPYSHRGKFF